MPHDCPLHPLPDHNAWLKHRRAWLDGTPNSGVQKSRQDAVCWRQTETTSLDFLQELLVLHQQALVAGHYLKHDRKRSVTAVTHSGQRYIVKAYHQHRPECLSHARQAWLASFLLAGLTPTCLGWRRAPDGEYLFFTDAGQENFFHTDFSGRSYADEAYAAVGRILAFLHQGGIVHRDCKPANFLLAETADGIHVNIIDCDDLRCTGTPLALEQRLYGLCQFIAVTGIIRDYATWRRCITTLLQGYLAAGLPEGAVSADDFMAKVATTLHHTAPQLEKNLSFWQLTPRPLEALPHGGECVGCGNCVAVCPRHILTLQQDLCGFLVRQVESADTCLRCGRCLTVCPMLAINPLASALPLPSCYAGQHRDPEVVRRSSSGGAFSALAETFLQQDDASIFGVAMQANQTRYIRISHREELTPLHGSKYLPSSITDCASAVGDDLTAGRPVLFVGLPCQIAALKLRLSQQNIAMDRLLLVDLICHGVPAPRFFELEMARLAPGTEVLSFRGKVAPHNAYNLASRQPDGSLSVRPAHTSLVSRQPDGSLSLRPAHTSPAYQGFAAKITLRDSCYHCRFARIPREADLTLGDFIGHPGLKGAFSDGLSLILANSEKGMAWLRESRSRLHLQPATLAEAAPGNPRLFNRSHPYEHHPLRRWLGQALNRWPWWLITLLYGGGYHRHLLGKLPFKLLYHFGKKDYRRSAGPRLTFFLRSPAATAPARDLSQDT